MYDITQQYPHALSNNVNGTKNASL